MTNTPDLEQPPRDQHVFGVTGGDAHASADGRWWWDGARWLPVAPGTPPGAALVHYSDDGRWWWDGHTWRPTRPTVRPDPPGGTLAHVALALSLVIAMVCVPLLLIGIADSRNSGTFAPGLGEFVFALLIGSPGVVLGTIALLRLPGDAPARQVEALVSILAGLGTAALLLLLIFI